MRFMNVQDETIQPPMWNFVVSPAQDIPLTVFQVFHSFKKTSSCHTLEIKPAMKRKRLLRKASECQNDPTNRFGALLKAPMYLPMREAFKMLNIMPILLEFSPMGVFKPVRDVWDELDTSDHVYF